MRQVDGSKKLHAILHVKYCAMAGANLFCRPANSCMEVKCAVIQKLILYSKLLFATSPYIAELRLNMDGLLEMNSFMKGKARGFICVRNFMKEINELHNELGHPLEEIT